MLPQPAKTGPGGALSINIDNDSMGDLGKAFGNALKPLVKGINNLNQTMIKAMAPDPESKTDRGKDLIKGPDAGKEDGSKMTVGKFGFGALAVLAAALTGTTKELQGIVNTLAFPKTLKLLKAPFTLLKKGFGGIQKLFQGIGNYFKKQTGPAGLRKTFGKAGVVDKFFMSMKRVGDSIGDLGKNVKGKIGGFFKGGVIDKFFTSTKNMTDGIKNFSPSTLKTQAAFGKGGNLGKFFLTTGNFVDRVKDFLTPVKNVLSGIGKIMEPLKKLGGGLGSLLKPLMPLVKTIFFPITIIMGIIDGIKGFIEGYKDQGFIDGLLTGLGNILGGIIGAPLDLVKNLAAFLLEKLGFEAVAEALKEFSFKDMIKNAFGGIANFFGNLPSIIEGAIRSIPKIGNAVADFIFGKSKASEVGQAQENVQDIDEKIAKARANKQGIDTKGKKTFDEIEADIAAGRDVSDKDRKFFEESKKEIADLEAQKDAELGKSIALQTEGLNLGAKKAAGMSTADILKENAAVLKNLSPEERDKLIQDLDTLSPQALKTQAQTDAVMAAEATAEDPLTDEQRAEIKEKAAAEFDKRKKRTIVPKAEAVPPTPMEGQALDEKSAPIVSTNVGGSSTDNSTTDNSTTSTNNSITNNNYGGGGGSGMDTRNQDGSLFNQQGTYSI